MRYQTVILEDDAREASVLHARIEDSPFADDLSVATVSDASQLTALIGEQGLPDILFADIILGEEEMNGIEAVRDLLPPGGGTQVIYVTGYAEYCVPVYETDHVYFLLKPVEQRTFNQALGRAVENLQEKEQQLLPVTYKGETLLIPFDEILYVESKLRKVIVHTADGEHEMYATLSDVLKQLPPFFARTHKSFLVNMDAIAKVDTNSVELRSGDVVPVGQRYSAPLKESLAAHFGMRN